jgi:DNA-binding response OmpR family regulator
MSPTERFSDPERCLILAHADIAYAARVSRQFRKLGWDVYLTASAAEARRLTRLLRPLIVVLDTELEDESGWLLCDKLIRDPASPKVILVTRQLTSEQARLASFVGAAGTVLQQDGIGALVKEVQGIALLVAG